ncbi:hypothetical protein SLS60_007863 [Paraconiothyrium brasiliense]|uniref:Zn(2)-C6 fungal-type domain-containing protein n=1 Tax=Paraconiothyrium brasiliense TaxID=300254 RepID=A0ABR3R412_9PLEO
MDMADPNQGAGSGAGDVSPTAASNAKARKRTKTGCLTCRKRRIKCGEERPTCANCIKSKRQCEGYNQRVIFKPPLGDWPNHPGVVTNLQYHNSMLPGTRAPNYRPSASSAQSPDSTLTSIQPRPLAHFDYPSEDAQTLEHLNTHQAYTASTQSYSQDGNYTPATKDQPQIPRSGFAGVDHVSPTQILDEAAVEEVDDDYWDVDSDADMADAPGALNEEAMVLKRDFSLMRKMQFQHTNELSVRRYDAFIFEGVLASYKAEQVANPLKNPKTARVFAHFIHVTAPVSRPDSSPRRATTDVSQSLSIYERNPRNPASLFEGPTPPSQQNLWTYILPLKALNHQGLLHAMLALASLHIAKLQRASLLAELDFPSLTREARRLKAAQEAQESRFLADPGNRGITPLIDTMMPDEGMVSTIIGKKVSYEDFGRVLESGDDGQERRSPLPGKLDIKTFETLQDLQWFYMRHDAFQSMVSGNPLM